MKISTILFDLDGTLIDSKSTIAYYFSEALSKVNSIPSNASEIIEVNLHKSFVSILKLFDIEMNPAEFENFLLIYRNMYLKNPIYKTTFFPNVREVLCLLKEMNYDLILSTGKWTAVAVETLKQLKVETLFKHIQGWNDGLRPKPEPDILKKALSEAGNQIKGTVIVGDSYADIYAGQALDIQTVAVTYGFEDLAAMQTYNPDFYLHAFKDLPDLLKGIS